MTIVQGGQVSVSGANFLGGESVGLGLDTRTYVNVTADANGLVPATLLTVPSSTTPGSHRVYAYGRTSKRYVSMVIGVAAAPRATLSVQPSVVGQGALLTVSGTTFAPGESIGIGIDGHPYTSTMATANGLLPATAIRVSSTTPAGPHTVYAYGRTSKRYVTIAITVTTTPAAVIAVIPTTINPGGAVTVSGANFQPGESIGVGLDGHTYANAIATAGGLLPATGFAIPLTTSPGPHTVYAYGRSSRREPSTPITVNPLAPSLTLDRASASVGSRVCVSGRSFLPNEDVTVAVDGVAVLASTASSTGTVSGCFVVPGNIVTGSNDATATGAQSHASALTHFTGVLTMATTFYFVGADTSASSSTDIAVVNTLNVPVVTTLRFYLAFTAPFDRQVSIPAHSRATIALGQYVKGVAAFAVRLQADNPVAAQMVVQRAGRNPYSSLGSGQLSTRWYLAEGYTGLSFHETLQVLNPNNGTVTVQVRLLPFNGGAERTTTYTIPAQRTLSVDVNKLYPKASISAIVTSNAPVAVERIITFGDNAFGATGNPGTALAATTWQFAEGSSANGFQTFFTILNPSATTATVTALFFDTTGKQIGAHTITIEPFHRGNIRINDTARVSSVATTVSSNVPVVVERALYFGDPNAGRTGGSIVFGRSGPSLTWTFPEGTTANGAHEFLLALNPNARTLTLRATFYLDDGQTVSKNVSVPAGARLTITAGSDVPGLQPSIHGSQLVSTDSLPFIAEQSVYNSTLTTGYATAGLAQ